MKWSLAALAIALLAACSFAPAATSEATPAPRPTPVVSHANLPQPTSSPSPTPATPTPLPTAQPTGVPSESAVLIPEELQGEWTTTLSPSGDNVRLRLGGRTYHLNREGHTASGQARVDGSQIEFYGNPNCPGSGVYSFVLEGDTLAFEHVGEPDPCARPPVLDGQVYTRD